MPGGGDARPAGALSVRPGPRPLLPRPRPRWCCRQAGRRAPHHPAASLRAGAKRSWPPQFCVHTAMGFSTLKTEQGRCVGGEDGQQALPRLAHPKISLCVMRFPQQNPPLLALQPHLLMSQPCAGSRRPVWDPLHLTVNGGGKNNPDQNPGCYFGIRSLPLLGRRPSCCPRTLGQRLQGNAISHL